MNTEIKRVRVLKPYLLDLLEDYSEVENNIGYIIQDTGYKNQFIADKLKLPISTYYEKKRKKTFSSKEVFQIVRMLDDEVTEAKELALAKERRNSKEGFTNTSEFINYLRK
jgi:hypothetical protein